MKILKKTLAISLMELTVALSIIATLSSISFSTYSKLKIEHRRNEALVKLIQFKNSLQQLAISSKSSVISIINQINNNTISVPGINSEPGNYYRYSFIINPADPTSYSLIATAIENKQQSKDINCLNITLTVTADQQDIRTPAQCWGM